MDMFNKNNFNSIFNFCPFPVQKWYLLHNQIHHSELIAGSHIFQVHHCSCNPVQYGSATNAKILSSTFKIVVVSKSK